MESEVKREYRTTDAIFVYILCTLVICVIPIFLYTGLFREYIFQMDMT